MTEIRTPISQPTGIAHVRLTVTDIERSKAFYIHALGSEPAMDFTTDSDEAARTDPARLFGGCIFAVGDQILGLRPAAPNGDSFSSIRVGLDHVALQLSSLGDLHTAVERFDAAGVEHGEVIELGEFGLAILSFQDPDDINLEFTAQLG